MEQSKIDELKSRLAKYEEFDPLSSLPLHPETPGYTTGKLLGDIREVVRVLDCFAALLAERAADAERIAELEAKWEVFPVPESSYGRAGFAVVRRVNNRPQYFTTFDDIEDGTAINGIWDCAREAYAAAYRASQLSFAPPAAAEEVGT